MILEKEVSAGGLTDRQYYDYVRLIRHAAKRVFAKHRKLWEEVDKMTKPLIKLPSVEIRELEEKLAKQEAELAKYEAELAEQKAENQRLQEMLRLAGTD